MTVAIRKYFRILLLIECGSAFIHGSPETVRTCENHQLAINCNGGAIGIIFAGYGREGGLTGVCGTHTRDCPWSSNALDIVRNACDGRQECTMAVSNGLFGDPCGGISKYLKVEYSCGNVTSTSSLPMFAGTTFPDNGLPPIEKLSFTIANDLGEFESSYGTVSYKIDFGDGTEATSDTPLLTHAYMTTGSVRITAFLLDSNQAIITSKVYEFKIVLPMDLFGLSNLTRVECPRDALPNDILSCEATAYSGTGLSVQAAFGNILEVGPSPLADTRVTGNIGRPWDSTTPESLSGSPPTGVELVKIWHPVEDEEALLIAVDVEIKVSSTSLEFVVHSRPDNDTTMPVTPAAGKITCTGTDRYSFISRTCIAATGEPVRPEMPSDLPMKTYHTVCTESGTQRFHFDGPIYLKRGDYIGVRVLDGEVTMSENTKTPDCELSSPSSPCEYNDRESRFRFVTIRASKITLMMGQTPPVDPPISIDVSFNFTTDCGPVSTSDTLKYLTEITNVVLSGPDMLYLAEAQDYHLSYTGNAATIQWSFSDGDVRTLEDPARSMNISKAPWTNSNLTVTVNVSNALGDVIKSMETSVGYHPHCSFVGPGPLAFPRNQEAVIEFRNGYTDVSNTLVDTTIQSCSVSSGTPPPPGEMTATGSFVWERSNSDSNPYIQFEYSVPIYITGVMTAGSRHFDRWVEEFKLECQNTDGTWEPALKTDKSGMFVGNSDQNTVQSNYFQTCYATGIRLIPVTWLNAPALRWQVIIMDRSQVRDRLTIADDISLSVSDESPPVGHSGSPLLGLSDISMVKSGNTGTVTFISNKVAHFPLYMTATNPWAEATASIDVYIQDPIIAASDSLFNQSSFDRRENVTVDLRLSSGDEVNVSVEMDGNDVFSACAWDGAAKQLICTFLPTVHHAMDQTYHVSVKLENVISGVVFINDSFTVMEAVSGLSFNASSEVVDFGEVVNFTYSVLQGSLVNMTLKAELNSSEIRSTTCSSCGDSEQEATWSFASTGLHTVSVTAVNPVNPLEAAAGVKTIHVVGNVHNISLSYGEHVRKGANEPAEMSLLLEFNAPLSIIPHNVSLECMIGGENYSKFFNVLEPSFSFNLTFPDPGLKIGSCSLQNPVSHRNISVQTEVVEDVFGLSFDVSNAIIGLYEPVRLSYSILKGSGYQSNLTVFLGSQEVFSTNSSGSKIVEEGTQFAKTGIYDAAVRVANLFSSLTDSTSIHVVGNVSKIEVSPSYEGLLEKLPGENIETAIEFTFSGTPSEEPHNVTIMCTADSVHTNFFQVFSGPVVVDLNFTEPGAKVVECSMSNIISQKSILLEIDVEERLEGLSVNVSDLVVDINASLTVRYSVLHGSDVNMSLVIDSSPWEFHCSNCTSREQVVQFTKTGFYDANVTATNSFETIIESVSIHVVGNVDKVIESHTELIQKLTSDEYAATSIDFEFTGQVEEMPHNVTIKCADDQREFLDVFETDVSLPMNFSTPGHKSLLCEASNPVSNKYFEVDIIVEGELHCLSFNVSDVIVDLDQPVLFSYGAEGTNVNLTWTVESGSEVIDRKECGPCLSQQLEYNFTSTGAYLVTVLAQNSFGMLVESRRIDVVGSVNDIEDSYVSVTEKLPGESATAIVQFIFSGDSTRLPRNVTIDCTRGTEKFLSIFNLTEEISLVFLTIGNEFVSCELSNPLSSKLFELTFDVEEPISGFTTEVHPVDIIMLENVVLMFSVETGSSVSYHVSWGDGEEETLSPPVILSSLPHTYRKWGNYPVQVSASNPIGQLESVSEIVRVSTPTEGCVLSSEEFYHYIPFNFGQSSANFTVSLFIPTDLLLANYSEYSLYVNGELNSPPRVLRAPDMVTVEGGNLSFAMAFDVSVLTPGEKRIRLEIKNESVNYNQTCSWDGHVLEVIDEANFLLEVDYAESLSLTETPTNASYWKPAPSDRNGYSIVEELSTTQVDIVSTFGSELKYLWNFQLMEEKSSCRNDHQGTNSSCKFYLWPENNFTLSVNISNPLGSVSLDKSVRVFQPVEGVSVREPPELARINKNVLLSFDIDSLGTESCYKFMMTSSNGSIEAECFYSVKPANCSLLFPNYSTDSPDMENMTYFFRNLQVNGTRLSFVYNFSEIDSYHLTLTGKNLVSRAEGELSLHVLEPACYEPMVIVEDENRCTDHNCKEGIKLFNANDVISVKSLVSTNCTVYQANYLWSVYLQEEDGSETLIELPDSIVKGLILRTLTIQPSTLLYGLYRVSLNVSHDPHVFSSDSTLIVVEAALIKVQISGGDFRTIPSTQMVLIDGVSESENPNVNSRGLTFHWFCRRKALLHPNGTIIAEDLETFEVWSLETGSRTVESILKNSSRLTDIDVGGCFGRYGGDDVPSPGGKLSQSAGSFLVNTSTMFENMQYEFKLVVLSDGLRAETTQTWQILAGDIPVMNINCQGSNCADRTNPTETLPLVASVNSSIDGENKTFPFVRWRLFDISEEGEELNITDALLSGNMTTSITSSGLAIKSGLLQPRHTYQVKLHASWSKDFVPYAIVSKNLNVNGPPTQGTCNMSSYEGEELKTYFTLACHGWSDDINDLPLTYIFRQRAIGEESWALFHNSDATISSPELFRAGLEEHNYTREFQVEVKDKYGAVTIYDETIHIKVTKIQIQVDESGIAETEALLSSLDDTLKMTASNGDVVATTNIAVNLISVINSISISIQTADSDTSSDSGTDSATDTGNTNSDSDPGADSEAAAAAEAAAEAATNTRISTAETECSSCDSDSSSDSGTDSATGTGTDPNTNSDSDSGSDSEAEAAAKAAAEAAINTRISFRNDVVALLAETKPTSMESVEQVAAALSSTTSVVQEVSEEATNTALEVVGQLTDALASFAEQPVAGTEAIKKAAEQICSATGNLMAAVTSQLPDKETEAQEITEEEDFSEAFVVVDSAEEKKEKLAKKKAVAAKVAAAAEKTHNLVGKIVDALANKLVEGEPMALVKSEGMTVGCAKMRPGANEEEALTTQVNENTSMSLPNMEALIDSGLNVDATTVLTVEIGVFDFVMRADSVADLSSSTMSVKLKDSSGGKIAVDGLSSDIEIVVPQKPEQQAPTQSYTNMSYPDGAPMVVHKLDVPEDSALFLDVRAEAFKQMTVNVTYDVTMNVVLMQNSSPTAYDYDLKCVLDQQIWLTEVPKNKKRLDMFQVESSGNRTCYFGNIELDKLCENQTDPCEFFHIGVTHFFTGATSSEGEEVEDLSQLNNTMVRYTMKPTLTKCYFASEDDDKPWQSKGCKVSSRSTVDRTICLCNHLTMFGGGFSIPINGINLSDSAFTKLDENPVVFAFLLACLCVYGVIVVWARKKDKRDLEKTGVTPLADNDPRDKYMYEVTVFTGFKNKCGTTAKVSVNISGNRAETGTRFLLDRKRKVFQLGGIDSFLLSTPESLGDLQFLRIWHDNSGSDPSWFLGRISVKDLRTEKLFYFLVDQWLAVEEEDGKIERVCPVAGKSELTSFGFLFYSRSRKNLSDGHLWFSIFARPYKSTFTCVQRTSCCLSLLFTAMMANIFFYNVQLIDGNQFEILSFGPISLTVGEVIIGCISSLMVFPINLAIVNIFRSARAPPRNAGLCRSIKRSCKKALRRKKKLVPESSYKRPLTGASNCSDSAMSARPVTAASINIAHEELLRERDMLEAGSMTPEAHGVYTISGKGKGGFNPSRNQDEPVAGFKRTTKKKKKKFSLPWYSIYFGWLLVILSVLVSFWLTVEVAGQFGKEKATEWLLSIGVSLGQDIFLAQPIKVLFLALFLSLIIKKPEEEEEGADEQAMPHLGDDEEYLHERMTTEELNDPARLAHLSDLKEQRSMLVEVPTDDDLAQSRDLRLKEIRMRKILMEILFYLIFLMVIMVISFGDRDRNSFMASQSMSKMFVEAGYHGKMKFSMVRNRTGFWNWTDHTLIPSLYSFSWYNGDPDLPGRVQHHVADQTMTMIGTPRFRQVRVTKDFCSIPEVMRKTVDTCKDRYNMGADDVGYYNESWEEPFDADDVTPPGSEWPYSVWKHQDWFDLKSIPYPGYHGMYSGGGYVAALGKTPRASWKVTRYLKKQNWVDQYTRAVFIEFVTYNPAINLFVASFLIMEFLPQGGATGYVYFVPMRLDRYHSSAAYVILGGEIAYILFICYFLLREFHNIRKEKAAYFKSFWNLLELFTIGMAIVGVACYLYQVILSRDLLQQYREAPNEFLNFQFISTWAEFHTWALSAVQFIATLKLLRLLRFNKRLQLLALTFSNAGKDMVAYSVVFGIVFMAYMSSAYLLFSVTIADYSTGIKSVEALFATIIGKFNFYEINEHQRLFGPIFFFSFVMIMIFILMSMFLSIINAAFGKVRSDQSLDENELEMVNFIMTRFLAWSGFSQRKMKKPTVKTTRYIEGTDEVSDQCEEMRTKLNDMVTKLQKFVTEERRGSADAPKDSNGKGRQIFIS